MKTNIDKAVENRQLQHLVLEVKVPVETYMENKNGKKVEKVRKSFPGYVFVNMILTDETWFVMRNTSGVTSFVGPGSKPVPLTEAEVVTMGLNKFKVIETDLKAGDRVTILKGPFENFAGIIEEINNEKAEAIVNVSMFGRETPVNIDFMLLEKE